MLQYILVNGYKFKFNLWYQIKPSRSVVIRYGFKGERQVITFSQNLAASSQTLLNRFPTLEEDRVAVPGTQNLL